MKILAIETSCDETAAAVVENGVKEVASALATSMEMHEKYGGIVPEVAARKQVESIVPVIAETLEKAKSAAGHDSANTQEFARDYIDAIAVTVGPGLIGSLIVGVEAAKALALAWNKPLIPVNHLVGHIYANFLEEGAGKTIEFPAIVLIVSGGHTDLVLMKGHGQLEYIGGTVDDAAGEAFDKAARILGIKTYYGGKALSEIAEKAGSKNLKIKLPRPMLHEDNFNFSFSGLKTAVKRLADEKKYPAEEIAKEFQNAVVDVLVEKTVRAADQFNVKSILLGGGVSANKALREKISEKAQEIRIPVYYPPVRLCTDNAVYIAAAAYFNRHIKPASEISVNPSLKVMDL